MLMVRTFHPFSSIIRRNINLISQVEQRNSQSESVFSEGASAPYAAGDEQHSLSSFTQLMSESFTTSFDLTSISENPAYMDSLKSDSPPAYPPQETDAPGDKPASATPGYYPAAMDPACMYYSGMSHFTPLPANQLLTSSRRLLGAILREGVPEQTLLRAEVRALPEVLLHLDAPLLVQGARPLLLHLLLPGLRDHPRSLPRLPQRVSSPL